MKKQDDTLDEKKRQLTEMTAAFCDARLDADYKRLCKKIINQMARMRPAPFLRGRPEIWAAGILHALGSVNFLFDKSFEPYVSATEIAQHFGVAPGSASQKAAAVREMFDLNHFNTEFTTKAMQRKLAPTLDMLAQMETLFASQTGGLADAEEMDEDEGEFIDGDHPVMNAYYDLIERYQAQGPTPAIQKSLEKIIERDPDFYDPYLMLRDLLVRQGKTEEGEALLEKAYRRALGRVTDETGSWPARLEWGWLENRHIIRTFLNQAIALWNAGDTEAALDLFRKLLRSNPDDNIGAREYILAIRLGMTFDAFEKKFMGTFGYDALKMSDWFDKHSIRFPDEFDWWKQAVNYEA
jgi:tetratricopeptide (TPR) repeat protein